MDFTATQLARLCWLAGRGATVEEVAADPKVGKSAREVAFLLDRMDLPPCARRDAPLHVRVELGRSVVAELDSIAQEFSVGRVEMAETILRSALGSRSILAEVVGRRQ